MSGYANLQKMMMLLWGGMSNLHETTIGTMWHACSLIPLEGTPAVITPLCPCCALYGIRLTPGKKEKYGIMPIAGKKRKRDYRLQLHGYRGGIKIGNGLVGYIHCGGNPSFLRALRLPQWIYPRCCHYLPYLHWFYPIKRFYPIKTSYFYMERRKVSLDTTIKRPPKLLGKRCPTKVLNTYGPAYATNLLFSTFF